MWLRQPATAAPNPVKRQRASHRAVASRRIDSWLPARAPVAERPQPILAVDPPRPIAEHTLAEGRDLCAGRCDGLAHCCGAGVLSGGAGVDAGVEMRSRSGAMGRAGSGSLIGSTMIGIDFPGKPM